MRLTSAPSYIDTADLRQVRLSDNLPADAAGALATARLDAPPVKLVRPCCVGDGVTRLTTAQETGLAKRFEQWLVSRKVVKFVPASGSASRMFQALRACLDRSPPASHAAPDEALPDGGPGDARVFLERLAEFAFFPKLQELAGLRDLDARALLAGGQWRPLFACLLDSGGLNYGGLPKGLIPYHRYPDGPRTAFEEHLLEAAGYARGADGVVRVHFTVSPEHADAVRQHLSEAARRFDRPGTRYAATVSVQKKSTDTLALDEHNRPVRDEGGKPVFKPSGHGAVLDNLDSIRADTVFIKTVDNVLPDRFKPIVCFYKRVLGGYLFTVESETHACLKVLASGRVSTRTLSGIERFARRTFSIRLKPGSANLAVAERARLLYGLLNRPLRVCGVVPRTGDHGGAPFWVTNHDGVETLRIVEPAEVDFGSEAQSRIWQSAAYFNPVDIVCSVRDFRGRRFRLGDYQDPAARFMVSRWHGNRQVRILERPGLWNGGMAHWNTVFVELPQITVHPVKSVVDLLSWQHRA